MTRFRMDNTKGYSAAELSELNAAWEEIIAAANVVISRSQG
jgi:hypothetical protein